MINSEHSIPNPSPLMTEHDGYRIPIILLDYSIEELQLRRAGYLKNIAAMESGAIKYVPHHPALYRGYVAWIDKRIKYLQLEQLITGQVKPNE